MRTKTLADTCFVRGRWLPFSNEVLSGPCAPILLMLLAAVAVSTAASGEGGVQLHGLVSYSGRCVALLEAPVRSPPPHTDEFILAANQGDGDLEVLNIDAH